MKNFLRGRAMSASLLISLAILGALLVASLFTAVEMFAPPSYSHSLAAVSSVTAEAWLIFDMETGEVLAAKNEEAVLPIASVTKLFTAQTVYNSSELWSTTTITSSDVATEGRAGRLRAGDTYTQYELLFPLLLESSNDAAVALERSNGAVLSTRTPSVELTDPSGLSAGNQASAMALRNVLRDIYSSGRQLIDITSLPYYLTEQNAWLNNSPFIKLPGYVGGKHGYTDEAGRTAAVIFNESLSSGNQRTIGYIILGSDNLAFDVGLLRDAVESKVRYR